MSFFKRRSGEQSFSLLHRPSYPTATATAITTPSSNSKPYHDNDFVSPCAPSTQPPSPTPSSPLSIYSYACSPSNPPTLSSAHHHHHYHQRPCSPPQHRSSTTTSSSPSATSTMSSGSDRDFCAPASFIDDSLLKNGGESSSGDKPGKPVAWARAATRIHCKTVLEEERRRQSDGQQRGTCDWQDADQTQHQHQHQHQQQATPKLAAQSQCHAAGEPAKKSTASSIFGPRQSGGWFGGLSSRDRAQKDASAASAYDYDAWLREI